MNIENQTRTIVETIETIRQGELKPVYLITGEEDFFVFEAKNRILQAILTLKKNAELINLESEKMQNVKNQMFSPSLFRSFQLFVIQDFNWLDKKNRDDFQVIIDRMIKGGIDSVLILTSQSVDKRLAVVKSIGKHGVHLDFPKVKTYGKYGSTKDPYYPVVLERLRTRNQSIANDAWKLLRELTRDDAWSVINAVDVVSGYAGEKSRIEKTDVEQCIIDNSEFPGYLVVQALGEKKPADIKKTIEKTLLDGTPPLLLSKTLSNRIRAFLTALMLGLHKTNLPEQYFTFRDIALRPIMERIDAHPVAKEILGDINPYALYSMLHQLKNFRMSELFECLENLADVDRLLKSGSTEIQGLFELAVMPLYHLQGERR